jgi:hypothetical protein
LPLVKTQVESQIKVRDMSRASVSITPAEFGSWADARAELITEEKRPLKAQRDAEIADAAGNVEAINKINANFKAQERALESEIDHKPMEFHMSLGISYNVSRRTLNSNHPNWKFNYCLFLAWQFLSK